LDDGSQYLFCLHLSFFLFAIGLLIYLFNINRATFGAVVWLIAITAVMYTAFSVAPFFDRYQLYTTPFSRVDLWLYLKVLYATAQAQ
jgi:hypothetical protein